MEDDVIFMRSGDDLVSLAAGSYEAEDILQRLLERHPQLLAGYQMSRDDPRRFCLCAARRLWLARMVVGDGGASIICSSIRTRSRLWSR